MKNCDLRRPDVIRDYDFRYDSFDDTGVLHGKKKCHLPAMGWNSWNAFGSGNTEALTIAMAEKLRELGLDKLGYRFLVLDDGCYKTERVNGRLLNDETRFPGGFAALSDRLHSMGLKFGMYNDIGTNLCASAAVGTCGHESEDAASYAEWGIDYIKVDNCYYPWDNATFSNPRNAKYTYTPAIEYVKLSGKLFAAADCSIYCAGSGIETREEDGRSYLCNIGTFDGTGPMQTPIGYESGEARIFTDDLGPGEYELEIGYLAGEEPGIGSWLQIAVGEGRDTRYFYDDLVPYEPAETSDSSATGTADSGVADSSAAGAADSSTAGAADSGAPGAEESAPAHYRGVLRVALTLRPGDGVIRIMNHRRQENTLYSYAKLLEGLNEAKPDHDIIYSLCEWGKTQPQNWAHKVGDSWRILNDITFAVGKDGDPGHADWTSGYTNSVTSQYNKAVIMDRFAGLDKGWNDPDMMVIGMDGLNLTQNRTHMAMWCMMNSPLMLGLDLRRVTKGDDIYSIIANEELIALNQDELGVQAKRVFTTLFADISALSPHADRPDRTYITNNDRADILAKPLADGSIAISFINLSDHESDELAIGKDHILSMIGGSMPRGALTVWLQSTGFKVKDLWTGELSKADGESFSAGRLGAFDNRTIRLWPEA